MPTFDDTLTRILRLGNLFDGSAPMTDHPMTTEGPVSFDSAEGAPLQMLDAPMASADRLYGPDYGEMITEHVQNYPQRESPGISRRLVAGLMGFGGNTQGGLDFLDRPYNQAVDDWKNQMAGLQSGALSQYRYGSLASRNAALKLREWKMQNPDWELYEEDDGTIIAINKNDPTQGLRTPYKSGDLGDASVHGLKINELETRHGHKTAEQEQAGDISLTNINRQIEGAGENIDRRISGQREIEGVREENRRAAREHQISLEGTKHQNTLEEIEARQSIDIANKPSDQKMAMMNRAREMQVKYPDLNIQIDNNEIQLPKPSSGTSIPLFGRVGSASEDSFRAYQEAVNYILGDSSIGDNNVMERPIPEANGGGIAISTDLVGS